MEFEVVVEDFQRLLKDNERNWSILDKSFDQLETDNLSGKEIAPQVSQKNFHFTYNKIKKIFISLTNESVNRPNRDQNFRR